MEKAAGSSRKQHQTTYIADAYDREAEKRYNNKQETTPPQATSPRPQGQQTTHSKQQQQQEQTISNVPFQQQEEQTTQGEQQPQTTDYFSKQRSQSRSLKATPTSSIFYQNFPKTPKFYSKISPNLRKILIFLANYAIIIVEKGNGKKQKL